MNYKRAKKCLIGDTGIAAMSIARSQTVRAAESRREAIATRQPSLVERYCTPRNKVISAPTSSVGWNEGVDTAWPVPEGAAKFGDYLGLSQEPRVSYFGRALASAT